MRTDSSGCYVWDEKDKIILGNEEITRKIGELVQHWLNRDFLALGLADPRHVQAVKELFDDYPLKHLPWDKDVVDCITVRVGDNRYSLKTSLVDEGRDGTPAASDIYLTFDIELNPLRVRYENTSY